MIRPGPIFRLPSSLLKVSVLQHPYFSLIILSWCILYLSAGGFAEVIGTESLPSSPIVKEYFNDRSRENRQNMGH